ncbi:hypothetical protein C2G38_850480 [Gigaspora rosea]|uniref:Uncharacterized protein n=1 Tax=Gigaspora rosea TaxID=44941 RepID=A0A397U0P1_9GLOM|nr:hypothetical protein C2G38_850480 [Gigaspora rosea]
MVFFGQGIYFVFNPAFLIIVIWVDPPHVIGALSLFGVPFLLFFRQTVTSYMAYFPASEAGDVLLRFPGPVLL